VTDFNPTNRVPTDDRGAFHRVAVAPRMPMTTTGPIFSSQDMAASIVAALMVLIPLAMAAFTVGRH
jgi:hypothetical protein